MPAIRHLSGALLDRVNDALSAGRPRPWALSARQPIRRLLADPNTSRTTLGSNALWQVALLEMWLQEQGVG